MWDAGKMLLATIIFTAVFYRLAAQETKLLDSAPNAVDDLYDTCSEEAKRKLMDPVLLEKELNSSVGFKTAWDKSTTKCSEQMPEGKKKEIIALSTYVNGDQEFLKIFNNEVETKGVNVSTYENDFHFKSLHFLLMSSMKRQPNNCKTVYGWSEDFNYAAKQGSEVRLGRFMIVEESYTELKKFCQDESVILNITSCFFVDLRDNTCPRESKDRVLLSPAEVFTVESSKTHDDDNTVILLKHASVRSYHGCYLSRSHANVSSQWLVLALVALSLFFLNC